MSVLIVIPARYESSRFPGKPLALLKGAGGVRKTLVQRCWEAALSVSHRPVRVVVATDDSRIFKAVQGFGGQAIMTSTTCRNGTERCAEAAAALGSGFEIIVNLQGDAPLTPPGIIDQLISHLEKESNDAGVVTPVIRTDPQSYRSLISDRKAGRVGATTVVFNKSGRALYFSKEIIPRTKEAIPRNHLLPIFHHLGVYAYLSGALIWYATATPGTLEAIEGLEQLRFLEEGIAVDCVEVELSTSFWEVNNPGDVAVVEALLESGGIE